MMDEKTGDVAAFPPLSCSVPRDLLEALLDNTYELRGERNWWKDEPRCNYQRDYQRYCEEIEQAEEILRQNASALGQRQEKY